MIKALLDRLGKAEEEPIQFDFRYIHKRKAKRVESIWKEYTKANRAVIDGIKMPRPTAMAYFDALFTSDALLEDLKEYKRNGGKVIGTMCNLVPEELIIAAGARPLRLCSGDKGLVRHGEDIYPRDCCDLVKSTAGQFVSAHPFADYCDAIAIPATCDGKKKLGETLASYKEIWMLDLPQTKDRQMSKDYWLHECSMLADRLSALTGQEVSRKNLRASISKLDRRNMLLKDLAEVRKRGVISGRDALIAVQASFYDDIDSWMAEAEKLLSELKTMDNAWSKDMPRVLLTGSPLIMPNFKIASLIENHGGIIIMDETCTGSQFGYDRVVPDDWSMPDMMRAVSERYMMPSLCPCFIRSEDRMDRILNLVKEYRVDGVIYNTLRLCLLFDIESQKVKALLEGKLPFLSLNTDYSLEDKGQLNTRIEAFIEMLSK